MKLAVLREIVARWVAVVALALAASILLPDAAHAAPSVFCPTLNATVANGGSVQINVSNCDGPFDGGVSNGGVLNPTHGNYVIGPNGGGVQFVTYTHNANSATSDQFELLDNDNGIITVNITINPPISAIAVTPTSLSALTVGTAFSQALSSTGGTAPYSYSLSSGTLPVGISLNASGVISGTPTHRGTYSFAVRSQDSLGAFSIRGYSGTVQNPSLSISPTSATAGQGVAFSQTLTAIGGVGPHSYQLESGTLPTGISISSAGVLSGTTSAAAGNYPVTFRVTDSSTGPGTYFELESFTLTVAALPSVSISVAPASVPEDGAANLVYTVTRSASSASPLTVNLTTSGTASSGIDYSGALSSVTIPANATTATVTINPTADVFVEGNETVVISVASGAGYTVGAPSSATGTIANDDTPIGTPSPYCSTQNLNVANGGSVTSINLINCDGPLNIGMVPALAAPPLHGSISVSPQSGPGNQTVTYTHNGNSATSDTFGLEDEDGRILTFNVTIEPATSSIVVTPVSFPALTAGAAVSQTLTSTGGTAPYSYSLSAGALPTGLSLSGDVISGTPTHRGAYNFSIRSQDSSGGFAIKSYSGTVGNPVLSLTPTTAIASQGVAFSQAVAASGGVAPYGFQLETGSFPAGISISSGGLISGTTNAATGNYPVTLRVTDSSSGPGTYFELENFTLTVAALPTVSIAVAPASVAEDGATNLVYTVTRSASSASPLTVNIETSGTATSGTDYTGGVASVTIPANATTATITIDLTADSVVEPNETVILGIATGAGYLVGTPSSATGTILNDDVPTASITVAPASVTEDSPTNLVYTIALDAASASAVTVNYTIGGTATNGTDYASIGTSVAFPAGSTSQTVVVNPNNDDTPEADETVIITLAAGAGYTVGTPANATGTILNDDVPLDISPPTMPLGTVGIYYSSTLTTDGGTGPYTYSVSTGSVPPGTTFAAEGNLSGTPIAAGDFSFTIRSEDSSGAPGPYFTTRAYTVTIAPPSIELTPVSLPNAMFGEAYSQIVSADGSIAPYSFAVTSGALPPGLTLAPSGALSGTPSLGGVFGFTITATDATDAPGPYSGGRAYSITVDVPALILPTTALPGGATDIAYSAQISPATGGVAPYRYSVTSGELPYGLTMSSTGAITGTPTTANLFGFVVTATDSNTGTGPSVVQQSYTIDIVNTPPVANPVSANVAYGAGLTLVPLSITGTANSVAVVTQPANGRAIVDRMTISYIPDTGFAGVDSFTYIASNNGANSAPALATISVGNPAFTITPGGPLNAAVGTPFGETFTFGGGTQPFTGYQIAGLPAGLQMGSSGSNTVAIVGTPTSAGSFPITVSATDASTGSGPFVASQAFTLVVDGPSLSMTPGSGTLTAPYSAPFSQAFVASGGIGPITYDLNGTLPAGLGFSGNTLSGSATEPGNYSITVTATDTGSTGAGSPFSIVQNYTVNVPAPTILIAPANLAAGTVGSSYNQSLSATGGVAPYGYAVTAGALPPGLALSAGGVLSGTPTAGGTFNVTLTATDANGQSASGAYSLTIGAAVVTLPPTSLAGGQVGVAYNAALNAASGGTAPYSYAVTAGALPGGMTLSADGTLSGTPSAFGSFGFSVTATDSSTGDGPYSATQNYSLQVIELPPVANPVSAAVGYGSAANAIALNITGGAATSVSVASGPSNGTATAGGTGVTYTPNTGFAGTDSFTYIASGAGGVSAPATVTVSVGNPAFTVTASGPLTATAGAAYSQTFTFSGGAQPFSAHQVTNLPAGLAVSGSSATSVTVSGTPTSAGSFAITVSATDASTGTGPFTAEQGFTLVVNSPALSLSPASGAFTASYAAAFNQPIVASGGVGPYSYGLTGTLPSGVTLDPSSGLLSGSPTASGVFSFAVTATDTGSTGAGAPFTVQGNYSLEVVAPLLSVAPTSLPAATAGATYTATLAVTGGVGPYRFVLGGGALPAGLSLSAEGVVSGTPTTSGDFAFGVQVTDANGQVGAANLTLRVGNSAIIVTPATLPAGTQGVAYSQRLTATGGIAPYAYSVSAGALPTGLTINQATGVISGTPTGSGAATFTVTVTDSTGGTPSTATINYTLQIVERPNPANDPEVRGLVQAQVTSARRFVDIQVGNFHRRLEGLRRGGGGGGFSNSLRISASDHCIDTVTAWTNPICASTGGQNVGQFGGPGGQSGALGGTMAGAMASGAMLGGGPIGSPAPTDGNKAAAGPGGSGDMTNPLAIWAGGTIRWGDRDETTGRPSQRFESEGVTFGADYRFDPSFAVGVGVGLGRDTTDIGQNGSQSRGEAKTLAVYGSHLFGGGVYFDWMAGYQWLDFDLTRHVTATGAMVNSSRSGRQWFGSVSAGADLETGNWRLNPYVRIDGQRGTLNGYTENSGSVFDLTFLDQDVAFASIGAGAKVDYRIAVENGFFIPRLRLEYQRDVERDSQALVTYFDQVSRPFYRVPVIGYARSRLLMGLGLEMAIGDLTAVDVEYSNRRNSGAGSDQGVLINIKQGF